MSASERIGAIAGLSSSDTVGLMKMVIEKVDRRDASLENQSKTSQFEGISRNSVNKLRRR